MKELFEIRHQTEPRTAECCSSGDIYKECGAVPQPLAIPMAGPENDAAPCCGHKPGPPSSPSERPGYRICRFVYDFVETPVGEVPRIETSLKLRDFTGTARARLGIARDRYRVAPGLYSVGKAGAVSPVLVTANYKLSFDSLRRELSAIDAWILVLDTRGVNVWCAAGKKTFSTEEIINRVKQAGLHRLVSHRELILPQLGAPGVSARGVKKGCGFKVIWGPVRAVDLPIFLNAGCKAERSMRQVTFSFRERIILIPVELSLIVKPSLAVLLAVFVLAGISPEIFSFKEAWIRGLQGAGAYLLGIGAGAVAVPALLPWVPVRRFYIKGILLGFCAGILLLLVPGPGISKMESLALLLLTTTVSSYAAMNFTGATPFTSPSGVEKEMRQGLPIQIIASVAAVIAWVAAPFVR